MCYRAFIETQSRFSLRRRKSRRQQQRRQRKALTTAANAAAAAATRSAVYAWCWLQQAVQVWEALAAREVVAHEPRLVVRDEQLAGRAARRVLHREPAGGAKAARQDHAVPQPPGHRRWSSAYTPNGCDHWPGASIARWLGCGAWLRSPSGGPKKAPGSVKKRVPDLPTATSFGPCSGMPLPHAARFEIDLEEAAVAREKVCKVDEVVLAEPALVGDRDRARRVGERVLVEHARARHRELRWLRSQLHPEEETCAV